MSTAVARLTRFPKNAWRGGGVDMTTTDPTTLVGVFQDRKDAEHAVDQLRDAGFSAEQLGFAGHGEMQPSEHGENLAAGATSGAVGGGILGGVIGAVAAGLIPGVGPIIGAGILVATVGGAAAGAATGGVLGGLTGLGVPEEEARFYEGEFNAGRTLVSVRAGDRYDEARLLLRRLGAYDLETRDAAATSFAAHEGDVAGVAPASEAENRRLPESGTSTSMPASTGPDFEGTAPSGTEPGRDVPPREAR